MSDSPPSPPAKPAELFRRSNSAVVTPQDRSSGASSGHFPKVLTDEATERLLHLPPPSYSHAVSSASPPPQFRVPSSSHFYPPSALSSIRDPDLGLESPSDLRGQGVRRLRHPRPDLLRLRNVLHERQLSLPVSGSHPRTGFHDRVTSQDEIEASPIESDDDTLSSGLSGYYPPPPEPAPPDFIPSNYRSHQQDLLRDQQDDEIASPDAGASAAAAPGIRLFLRTDSFISCDRLPVFSLVDACCFYLS